MQASELASCFLEKKESGWWFIAFLIPKCLLVNIFPDSIFCLQSRTLVEELERLKVIQREDELKAKQLVNGDDKGKSPGRNLELLEEAKLLRQHKGRLEARMQILEDHNRQLEAQLQRLRQLLEQVGSLMVNIVLAICPMAAYVGHLLSL